MFLLCTVGSELHLSFCLGLEASHEGNYSPFRDFPATKEVYVPAGDDPTFLFE